MKRSNLVRFWILARNNAVASIFKKKKKNKTKKQIKQTKNEYYFPIWIVIFGLNKIEIILDLK